MSHPSVNDFLDEDSFFSEMLSSQSDLEDQLLILKEVVDSDRSLDDKLNELQNFLSNSSIRNATLDILDEKIFKVALDGAQKLYYEIMKSIEKLLQNQEAGKTEDVKNQLNMLVNLLQCWDSCISHIKALEKLSISNIKSFPPSLFEIMIDVVSHCKKSANSYGTYFQAASQVLTSIFRQCANTLNSFYALLDAVISFDTNEENDMKILLKIIESTGKLAALTSGMDAKTLTDMWKRFGKLSTCYSSEMKNISPDSVTCHFKGLSDSITTVLANIDQKNARTANERSILCCRLLLKILEKLCETYCGWIRNDVMIEIISLLCNLHRFTEQFLKINNYNADFVKFTTTNFSFMIQPFLDVVYKSDSFKTAFFNYGKSVEENALGYHMLILKIISKLSALPYNSQKEWCTSENSILDFCFKNIDLLSKDICIGKMTIQMPRDPAQGSYLANIYEATCVSIFSMVAQVPNSDFTELNILLLKYLMGGEFFSSLLSSDVWCFICRLGSSDLCYSLFKYLMKVYDKLKDRKDNFNVFMLSNLISRQYTFLSDKDKVDFISNIKGASDVHQWDAVARVMDQEKKKQLQDQINAVSFNKNISVDLKNLEEQPTLENFSTLIKNLAVIEASGIPQDEHSVESFVKMWNKVVHTMGDSEGTATLVLEDFAISLLRATNIQGQAKYTTTVLESLSSLYPYASSAVRLESCRLLERSAAHLTEANSAAVAELFCRLLSDEEPWVQQRALECFEALTRVCPNAGFLSAVAMAIRNSQSEAARTLPAYIAGEAVHRLQGFRDLDEYFAALCAAPAPEHQCPSRGQEEKLRRLDGDEEDAEGVAKRLCTDVDKLLGLGARLRPETREKLRSACRKLLEQGEEQC